MVIQNILLVVIVILLYAIYIKKSALSKIEKKSQDKEELNTYESSLDDEEIEEPIQHIEKSGIKRNTKLELREYSTLMSRYSEFLNQSKVFRKIDVINSLNVIKVEGGTVDDCKIFFLTSFTELIFSNGLTFKDLDIDNDYYGYGPSEANSIWFDIENIKETKDGGDYRVFEAEVVFTLKDKSKKTLKYEFYDDTIDEFNKWYKAFEFIDGYEEIYPYYVSYKPKAKYRIVLNDLFQYLDFVGKHFYNKEFIKWNFLRYNFESLLTNDYGEYEDKSWQIDKKNFQYVDEMEKRNDIDIIDNMTNNELFVYAINLYYKEYSNYKLKDKIFKVVKYLDKLVDNNYPMAYLVKGLLHLDGKIVLRDLSAANFYLHKAYDLGLQTPTLLIWNENDLFLNSKYSSFSVQKVSQNINPKVQIDDIQCVSKEKNITEQKSENNEKVNETTNDIEISFEDKFNSWYNDIKDKEVFKDRILSTFVKSYSDILYDGIDDEMIAYLFENALYKGYVCAEYFINEKKYNDNIEIEYTNEPQSTIAMLKLDELMGDTNDEDFIKNNIDDFFHKLILKDKGSYENVVIEEQREEIIKSSKYYMMTGVLYRFTELNMKYSDFPNETDVSAITQKDYPKLYEYIRK